MSTKNIFNAQISTNIKETVLFYYLQDIKKKKKHNFRQFETMDETHLSRIAFAESARETSLPQYTRFFFLLSHARECTKFTLHDLTEFLNRIHRF